MKLFDSERLPRDADGPVFAEPWEAQAFAMAVKLNEVGVFGWAEWAEALGAELKRHPQRPYTLDYIGIDNYYPLDDRYYRDRVPDWSKVKTPFLSAANWGGQGLHPRGNFEGFVRAAADEKWLEVHGIEHWTHFYTDYGVALQKKFFGHFLKGEDTGVLREPRVKLLIRKGGHEEDTGGELTLVPREPSPRLLQSVRGSCRSPGRSRGRLTNTTSGSKS